MAQISRQALPNEVRQRIDQELIRTFFQTEKRASAIFEELLTDTERLMLAKRLTALLLLIDGHSYYRIEQTLGMSTSTSKRLHSLLIGGAFEHLENLAAERSKRDKLMKDIERLVRAGLPPNAYVIKRRHTR